MALKTRDTVLKNEVEPTIFRALGSARKISLNYKWNIAAASKV